ncbi:MAG: response regulator [Ardenticatenia bacterium]|nr:response regulator [Ardenticatenia bacterium]
MSAMSSDKPLILVAERDPFMRVALMRVLGTHFQLTFAENGHDVLYLARDQQPVLIILEVLLPELDGFQVCRRLKQTEKTRHIPVLFFTFLLAEEQALQAGADAFLLKPLRQTAILETIYKLIES